MKRLLFLVVIAVLAVACLGLLAAPALAKASIKPVSPPPPPPGSVLVENLTFKLINGEDFGTVGYWALDNSSARVSVWQVPDGTFWALFKVTDGRWTTFAGAFSPNAGVPEEAQGSGTYGGWWTVTFSGEVIPGQKMFGYAGVIDGGGTASDIALGTYDLQTGTTNPWDPIASYFTSSSGFSDETLQQMWEWYRYNGQTLVYTALSTTGDIVVTK